MKKEKAKRVKKVTSHSYMLGKQFLGVFASLAMVSSAYADLCSTNSGIVCLQTTNNNSNAQALNQNLASTYCTQDIINNLPYNNPNNNTFVTATTKSVKLIVYNAWKISFLGCRYHFIVTFHGCTFSSFEGTASENVDLIAKILPGGSIVFTGGGSWTNAKEGIVSNVGGNFCSSMPAGASNLFSTVCSRIGCHSNGTVTIDYVNAPHSDLTDNVFYTYTH